MSVAQRINLPNTKGRSGLFNYASDSRPFVADALVEGLKDQTRPFDNNAIELLSHGLGKINDSGLGFSDEFRTPVLNVFVSRGLHAIEYADTSKEVATAEEQLNRGLDMFEIGDFDRSMINISIESAKGKAAIRQIRHSGHDEEGSMPAGHIASILQHHPT